MGHIKTMKTRMYNKMNLIDLLLHLHKRTTMPMTMKKDKRNNKTVKQMFYPDPNKSSHEFEQESRDNIPSNKSSVTLKLGESLALKLIWLTFVNTTHSFLVLNL